MASDEQYKNFEVTLQNGKVVTVQVSPELLEHYNSTDPDAKTLAQTLIVQAALEKSQTEVHGSPEMGDELPDITPIDTAGPSASGTPSPSPMPSGWSEKAENCLLDFFGEVSKQPVKNKWLKIAGKMKDIGFDYSSEQCRLKIKSLKERHARLSKKRCTSGEGGVEDVLEDKMAETFSTPDCKPVHISESGKGNSDAQSSSDTSDEKLQPVAKKVKKCEQKPTVMDILERAEKESEKRHKEKMEIMKGFIDLMSKMVKKE